MTISFIGADDNWVSNTWYTAGTNPLQVPKPAGTTEDDLLIAYGRQGFDGNVTDLVSNGWTVLSENAGAGNSYFLAYQIAGASEPANYDFTTDVTDSNNDGGVTVEVYRGVSTDSPLDVTYSDALHRVNSANGTDHTPADITTKALNSWVVTVILTSPTSGAVIPHTKPTDYTLSNEAGLTSGPNGAGAYKLEVTPGAKSPGDWTISVSSTAVVFTLALRDVDATLVEISNVEWDPPLGWSWVQYNGDVLPPSSALYAGDGTHTGSDASATLTDSSKSLAADEWKGRSVFNFHDNSTGVIGTHSAGSGPFTLSSALSGGDNDNFDAGDRYYVTTAVSSGDQIVWENVSDIGGSITVTDVGVFQVLGTSSYHVGNCKLRDATDSKVSNTFAVTLKPTVNIAVKGCQVILNTHRATVLPVIHRVNVVSFTLQAHPAGIKYVDVVKNAASLSLNTNAATIT